MRWIAAPWNSHRAAEWATKPESSPRVLPPVQNEITGTPNDEIGRLVIQVRSPDDGRLITQYPADELIRLYTATRDALRVHREQQEHRRDAERPPENPTTLRA